MLRNGRIMTKHHSHFFEELGRRIRGDLKLDTMSKALYSTDASNYQIMPVGVVVPRTVEDVSITVETAAQHGVPVLARGGGSSLAGQTVGEAVVIDFSVHLDRIVEVNGEQQWVRTQPGIVLQRLNAAVAEYGLMVGPDPASGDRATVGGMVANNSTGTHSILYGNMIDHVLAADVVLSNGDMAVLGAVSNEQWAARKAGESLEGAIYRKLDGLAARGADVIREDTPKHWRRNSGYRLETLLQEPRNLAKLICGSEGTLAIVTEVVIGLVPRPKMTALGVAHFKSRSDALRSVTGILSTDPSAVELFDGVAIHQARKAPGFADRMGFVQGEPGAVLIVEYYGESVGQLEESLDKLIKKVGSTRKAYAVHRLTDKSEIKNVWDVRKEVLGLVMGITGDYKPVPFIEDASVPVEHLADYIEELDRYVVGTGTRVAYYAHASAGCLHARPFLNLKKGDEINKMRDISLASMELVRRYGGVVSSEHGDGLARSWLNEPFLGTELYSLCREVKHVFDPTGILNPGKKVDAPDMGEDLRFGADYRTEKVSEILDFSPVGGLTAAVEMCNGNGACRKLDSGTMCPSFMVTREEEHSTRGRANALRAVLSGHLPADAMSGKRMFEVMDLCVQCKACKTECPSNVDMARLKTEWLARYWQEHSPSLRTRVFARLPKTARRLGPKSAATLNWLNRAKLSRKLLEVTVGVSAERPLPAFAAEPFTEWYRKRTGRSGGPEVVLFADTFNNYLEPEIAQAATEAMERVGYRVILPEGPVCCGRTYLSKGFVVDAQRIAIETVDALWPFAQRGIPIVGLEPSCILTLRDEFLALLPGERRAVKVAASVQTFEEFVARDKQKLFRSVSWPRSSSAHVFVHNHCHQRSLVGNNASVSCFHRCGFSHVDVPDTGCCGMAGAFGYEKEHVAISRSMAERRLAPSVRSLPADTIIVAAGTSCRAQIVDTTGREAFHPAQVIRKALSGRPVVRITT